MNSDFTPFDQIVLDPELCANAPPTSASIRVWAAIYTASKASTAPTSNEFSKSYGEKALQLCREVYVNKNSWDDDSDDKLMMASYAGGNALPTAR